jgi:cyanophycin synthetase
MSWGGSLRVIGRSGDAVAVLREVCDRWPGRGSARLFLALALLDDGAGAEAVREAILGALAGQADPDVEYYRRALTVYAEALPRS